MSHDFLFYIILRRIVLGQKISFGTQLLRNTRVTMATSSLGTYHGPWSEEVPTKCIDVIPTLWAMKDLLGLIEVLQVHK